MFSYKFFELNPFVTVAGNELMKNINATHAFGDVSLTATMRALLFERLNGAEFYAYVTDAWPSKPTLQDALAYLFGNTPGNKIIFFHTRNLDEFDRVVGILSEEELKKEEACALSYQKDLSQAISAKASIACHVYNNPEKNIALIVVKDMDIRILRLLSTLMTRYCPNFFKDKPITPEERELLETLTRRSSDDYKNALIKIGKKMNLRDSFLKIMVCNFERREIENLIKKTQSRIRDLASQVENYMQQYADAVQRHKREMMTLEGMKLSMENQGENSELLAYLTTRKNVELNKIDGNTICITIRTFLDVFDQTIWDKYAARGEIFRNYSSTLDCFKAADNAKMLLNAIFCEDPVLRLKTCGYYQLSLTGNVYTQRGYNYGPEYDDCIPNPHLQYHACLGNNQPQISRMLNDGNLIGALECAAASCKSLNMGEITQTVRPMLREILSSKDKIIWTEEGDKTPEEALAWLKAKEESKK